MTAPTREQCEAWARSIEGVRVFDMGGSIFGRSEYLQRFAALAFAAGAASRPVPTGPDVLTEEEIRKLVEDAGYYPEKIINSIAINAARLERQRDELADALRGKLDDMDHYLHEAHGFAAMSPRGKENIAGALEIVDELRALLARLEEEKQ